VWFLLVSDAVNLVLLIPWTPWGFDEDDFWALISLGIDPADPENLDWRGARF
jgi:hypothetical protein